jgi:FkbM family methyltransferase
MHVVDIGGNIGFYTVLFSRLVGEGGKVTVFEPDVANFGHLKKNTKGLRNVVLKNVAVAERSGTIRLYRSDELNVDHQTYDAGEGRSFVEVTCITLDDYFSAGGKVDFIKMDVQGYEYYVLLGTKEVMSRASPVTIFTEFWPYGLLRAGIEPKKFLHLLEEMGFEITFWDRPAGLDWKAAAQDKAFYTNLSGTKR